MYSQGAGNDAFMEFHVGGDYATYFGLDGDTNDLFVGGWSKGAQRYKMWHAGNDGSGSGLDADTVDGNHASSFALLDHVRSTGSGNHTSTTTADLLTEVLNDGAFDSRFSTHKTGWTYAGNGDLTDAGRLTELAGTSWAWWTDNPADGTQGRVTGLVIAPNTGGSAGKMFVYNDQGSGYAPGWREVWTSRSDGSGSGLDADLLDGLHASSFLRSDADDQTTNVLSVGNSAGAINGEKLRVADTGTFIASFQRTDGTPHLLFKGTGGTSGHTGRFYMDNGSFQLSQGDSTGGLSGNIWLHGNSSGNVGIGTGTPGCILDIYKSTGTSGTATGTTFLTMHNYVGSDLTQQKTFIDFEFTDDNANNWPQVRIGAEVGQNGDANSTIKEGSGAFVVYTNSAANSNAGEASGMAERFRVDYTGNVTVSGDVTAYYSDERLKDFEGKIDNALDIVSQINGYYYTGNKTAGELGYDTEIQQVGVISQEVEAVLPHVIKDAPINKDNGTDYKTVQYERLVPVLIEAIKEQQTQIDELKDMVRKLTEK